MWFNMYDTDLRTLWRRTVEIGQGDSTGWAKKFEKKFEFFTISRIYVHISQKRLKIEAYKQRTEKVYPSPIQLSHVYGRIAHGVLQGWPKLSDVIPVLRITPAATEPSTVSVFLSVVKCGRLCRAQTCAHSAIEPSTLAKGFLQSVPKTFKKFRIFEYIEISRPYISATVTTEAYGPSQENILLPPYPPVASISVYLPQRSTGWVKKLVTRY